MVRGLTTCRVRGQLSVDYLQTLKASKHVVVAGRNTIYYILCTRYHTLSTMYYMVYTDFENSEIASPQRVQRISSLFQIFQRAGQPRFPICHRRRRSPQLRILPHKGPSTYMYNKDSGLLYIETHHYGLGLELSMYGLGPFGFCVPRVYRSHGLKLA